MPRGMLYPTPQAYVRVHAKGPKYWRRSIKQNKLDPLTRRAVLRTPFATSSSTMQPAAPDEWPLRLDCNRTGSQFWKVSEQIYQRGVAKTFECS